MDLVKIPNTPFVRDTKSMAIINVDSNAKLEYYEKSRTISQQKQQINKINEDISELRGELGEIKQLLKQLVDKQ